MKILYELSWLWETLGIALVAAAVCMACAALICKDCATCADGEQSYVISYNPIRRQGISKDNLVRLREVYPEIYAQFVETSESRRFSIKIAAQPAA